ncbi:T9SS type A sorting domain-containing protein [Flavobacterium collinsii]|uniref:Secretion system C-terminal sorting domain-containing protein n=1 Tax=Flavobacterium collinsii TaxID=1114861 RepID=A0ABM8KPK7_9FLAO|nr:T9SS type A sorting domain-containing protein [Flavobacterium collinsii]GIQ61040.1 hypothetical protein Flavo103_41760 [Flavobacterium collinsii]CAA9202785.1 hypothetical protein FLACOL7796_04430 [Flavobacterium collinsii]
MKKKSILLSLARGKTLKIACLLFYGFCTAQLVTNNCNKVKISNGLVVKVNGNFSNTANAGLDIDGTLNIDNNLVNNGSVTGNGILIYVSDFTNTGSFSPGNSSAGALAINGNFSNGTGVLNFKLAGTTAATQYDQLNITGNFSCSGTINVATISGFTPASNTIFELIKASSLSGTFATKNLPANWTIEYTATKALLKYNGNLANEVFEKKIPVVYLRNNILYITSEIAIQDVTIYDVNGRKLFYQTKIKNNDYSKEFHLNNGLYIVHILDENHKLSIKKVIN